MYKVGWYSNTIVIAKKVSDLFYFPATKDSLAVGTTLQLVNFYQSKFVRWPSGSYSGAGLGTLGGLGQVSLETPVLPLRVFSCY